MDTPDSMCDSNPDSGPNTPPSATIDPHAVTKEVGEYS